MFIDDVEVTLAVRRKATDIEQKSTSYVQKSSDEDTKVTKHPKLNKDIFSSLLFDKTKPKRLANYEFINVDRDTSSPGERGKGYSVGKEDKEKEKQGYDKHAFNQLVSDRISIYRSLEDYRNIK